MMPALNAERYIKPAIQSVLNQNGKDFELIVVDDHSTDGTFQLASCFGDNPRVRIFRNRRTLGVAGTRALILSMARGRYIVHQDADDLMLQGRLKEQLEFMEKHPAVGLVFGSVLIVSDSRKELIGHIHPYNSKGRWMRRSGSVQSLPSGFHLSSAMIRKEQIGEAGGYQSFVELDTDSRLSRALFAKTAFYFLKRPVLVYRIHAGSHCQRTLREGTEIMRGIFSAPSASPNGTARFFVKGFGFKLKGGLSDWEKTIAWRLNFYLRNKNGVRKKKADEKVLAYRPGMDGANGQGHLSDEERFAMAFLEPFSSWLAKDNKALLQASLVSFDAKGVLIYSRSEELRGEILLSLLGQDATFHSAASPVLSLKEGKVYGETLVDPIVLAASSRSRLHGETKTAWGRFWNPLLRRYCINVDLYRDYLVGNECMIETVVYLDVDPRHKKLRWVPLDFSTFYALLTHDELGRKYLSFGPRENLLKALASQARAFLVRLPQTSLAHFSRKVKERLI